MQFLHTVYCVIFNNLYNQHCKGINIYYIAYITIKKIDDSESICSVNPLFLQVNHASGYIEENTRINI